MAELRTFAVATLMLTALASTGASAATYSCVGGTQSGAGRSLSVELDPDAMTASAPTREGLAEGILQTTTDLYISRMRTAQGRVYMLTLHRRTGRLSLMVESAIDPEDIRPEFTGTCSPQV